MESKDKLNETDIKNSTCYYFDERIRFWDRDIDFSDVFLQKLEKEKYEYTLIYGISDKTSKVEKSLCIRNDNFLNL